MVTNCEQFLANKSGPRRLYALYRLEDVANALVPKLMDLAEAHSNLVDRAIHKRSRFILKASDRANLADERQPKGWACRKGPFTRCFWGNDHED
jgi:hypothetical protein